MKIICDDCGADAGWWDWQTDPYDDNCEWFEIWFACDRHVLNLPYSPQPIESLRLHPSEGWQRKWDDGEFHAVLEPTPAEIKEFGENEDG